MLEITHVHVCYYVGLMKQVVVILYDIEKVICNILVMLYGSLRPICLKTTLVRAVVKVK